MKPLILPVLLLGNGLIAAGFYHVGTIQHSLSEIEQAIKTKDRALFGQYVNVENVSQKAAADLLQGIVEERSQGMNAANPWGGYGLPDESQIAHKIREGIFASVEAGTLPQVDLSANKEDSQQASLMGRQQPASVTIFPAMQQIRKGKVHREWDRATAEFFGRRSPDAPEQSVRLSLARTSKGYWQVTEIANYDELLQFEKQNRQAKQNVEEEKQQVVGGLLQAFSVIKSQLERGKQK